MNLILNLEKCHFIKQEEIVLSHLVLDRNIEVNRATVETNDKRASLTPHQ